MDNRELLEKINAIFSDEALAKELLSIEKPEDAQIWLENHDVELTLDDVKALGTFITKVNSGDISEETLNKMKNGELDEDELEQVCGGSFIIGLIVGALVVSVLAPLGKAWNDSGRPW